MNILITGSNGFIGSILVKYLKKEHKVIGVGRKSKPNSDVDRYIQWDISKSDCQDNDVKDEIDVIIHAAACISIEDSAIQLSAINCVGTQRIFALAIKKRVKKLIYISSAPIIGKPLQHPINENHPNRPFTIYHATKLAGEIILNQLERYGIENINLRIPSPIYTNMPIKTIVPLFVSKAIKNETITVNGRGTRRQNYLDVRDLANVIEKCLVKNNIQGTYIVASDKTISNIELAKLCVKITNSQSKIVFSGKEDTSDGQVWDYDNSSAKKHLEFVQTYPIEKTIEDMEGYMRSILVDHENSDII